MVHSLAHRLPGLSKSSRADPDAEGQRMVCVERVAPSTAAAPAAAAKPEPDADPVLPRRSRWRRAAGVVTEAWIFPALSVAFQALQGTAPAQLSDDALRATAGYPHLEDLGSRAKGWQTDDAPGSVEITWPRSASPHRRPFPFPPQADQQA